MLSISRLSVIRRVSSMRAMQWDRRRFTLLAVDLFLKFDACWLVSQLLTFSVADHFGRTPLVLAITKMKRDDVAEPENMKIDTQPLRIGLGVHEDKDSEYHCEVQVDDVVELIRIIKERINGLAILE